MSEQWIWFDVDDVMVDTSDQIEKSLRKFTGLHVPVEQWPNHMFFDIYKLREEQLEGMRDAWVSDQVLEKAAMFETTKAAMALVAQKGYKTGMITARGWHPKGKEITEEMAHSSGLPLDRLILLKFHESKKDLLAQSKTVIAGFVDDTPRHVQGAIESGWQGHLMSRSWNQHSELPRVSTLMQFAENLPEAAPSRRAKFGR